MNDRITALEDITDPDFIWGALDNVHDAETTLDDYVAAVSRAQRAALAASRAAHDCHQPDLVTADRVRIKPLVWVRHWAGCHTVKSLKTEDNACDVVYYAERAEKTGHIVNTVTKPGYFRCWVDFGEEFESLEAAKAAVQADYDASILAALDLTPAPAVEPVALTAQDAARVPEIAALTDDQVASACLSYRHDFGLLDASDRAALMWDAREWLRAWQKELPSLRAIGGDA